MTKSTQKVLKNIYKKQGNTRIQWEEQRNLGLDEEMIMERDPDAENLGDTLGNPGCGWWSNAWVRRDELE
ncbi:MAG: hypothetical protein ACOX3A_11415 [bacterium]|jgi:hypothetical protein